jgi:hypothetical protein
MQESISKIAVSLFLVLILALGCGSNGNGDESGDAKLQYEVSFSGNFCGVGELEHVADSSATIKLLTENGDWVAILVSDGDLFDPESESEWQQYALGNDTYILIGLSSSPQIPNIASSLDAGAPTVDLPIFDSFLGGTGGGTVLLNDGVSMTLQILDTQEEQIQAIFQLGLFGAADYPPVFADIDESCDGPVNVVIQGPYTEVDLNVL